MNTLCSFARLRAATSLGSRAWAAGRHARVRVAAAPGVRAATAPGVRAAPPLRLLSASRGNPFAAPPQGREESEAEAAEGADGVNRVDRPPAREPSTWPGPAEAQAAAAAAAAAGQLGEAGAFDAGFDESDYDSDDDMVTIVDPSTGERGGPTRGGTLPEPTRYGDWERKGRVTDF